ncbi:mas-related G-protein coupled receptor member X2 [Phacochoerus africanus]|uniref:mas-related G-protein coupled receptor member X2 n=1 Tax=Phacochoerus africanus TaxID=41426 RepID=UPI001FD9771C|nr:mas-related G-protein coupled receptor member X2 [Phacochoerus africanus]
MGMHLLFQRVKKQSLLPVNHRKGPSFPLTTSSKKNGAKVPGLQGRVDFSKYLNLRKRLQFPPVGTRGGFLSLDPTTPAWETEPTPMGGSNQTCSQVFDISLTLLTGIMALGGLAGNAVVMWLLGFRLRRNSFSVYILNLAAADFLFLLLHILSSLENLIISFHSSAFSFPRFFITVLTFAYLAGLSLLSAISTERCLSVLCPIWYRCRRPRHLSAVMCALLWALSLLLSILEAKDCGFLSMDFNLIWCRLFDFITAGWLTFLFVLLAGSSLTLLGRILSKSQRLQLTRLYVTVALTVLVFLICGLPFGVYWFIIIWIHSDLFMYSCHFLVASTLSCVNSCTNPIIYFLVGSFRRRQRPKRRRRQTLRVVLQKALEDVWDVDESEGTLPQETLEVSGSSLVP